MTRALVVEDRANFAPNLRKALEGCGVTSAWLPHARAELEAPETLAALDLILLDAYDIDSQQADLTRSRLGALTILDRLRTLPEEERPPVIVYSTHMRRPEINIPVREWGLVAGCFEAIDLVARIDRVVVGDLTGQVDAPTPDDWAELHPRLPVGALVAEAHQLAQTHPPTWEAIWNPDAPFGRAANRWITRNLLPLLSIDKGYMVAVHVIRKIACLPSVFGG